MNRERDPFDLSSLPPLSPPADAWPQIAGALQQHQRQRRAVAWLAIAAALTLAVGVTWQLPRSASIEAQTATATTDPAQSGFTGAVTAQDNLEAMIRLSQQLERNLRLVRSEIDAMPAQSVAYQIELEDLVAQVDDALNLKPDSRELWSQRVNLLLDLEQLYRRELRRDYSHLASL